MGHEPPEAANDKPSGVKVDKIHASTGVAIGHNARSIVVQIGSLFNLASLARAAWRHWALLTGSLVLQSICLALWWCYGDRFLLPVWLLAASAGLLEIGVVAGYCLARPSRFHKAFVLAGAASLLTLGALAAIEYRQIAYPERFADDTFGVAIAHFGEGPDLRRTGKAREVSGLVFKQLDQRAKGNPDLQFVKFRSIGLVRSEDEARQDGQRIGADLVIWGQLQVGESATTLHFTILETPDKVSNPAFPRVVPIAEQAATGIVVIPNYRGEEIAKQTTQIAAFTFGLAHFFRWDFASAIVAFEEVLSTPAQESYLLHLYYGLSLQWLGELEEAEEQLEIAASIDRNDPAAPLGLALGYKSMGLVDKAREQAGWAEELCTDRLKRHPNDALAYYDRAVAYEVSERWQDALANYGAAVERDPDLYVARLSKIRMLITLGQMQQAINAGQEAAAFAEGRGANPAWAYLFLALAYQYMSDSDNARAAYQKATRLAPDVEWIHLNAATFYEDDGDLAAAQKEYEAMALVSADPAWGHAELGRFFARHEHFEEAVAEFWAALQFDPAVGGVWIDLANAHVELGQHADARQAYERAVDAEPGNYHAWVAYGNWRYKRGELVAAIEQWLAAYNIDSSDCNLLLNLGAAYESVGAIAEAKDIYTQALGNLDFGCRTQVQERLDRLAP